MKAVVSAPAIQMGCGESREKSVPTDLFEVLGHSPLVFGWSAGDLLRGRASIMKSRRSAFGHA